MGCRARAVHADRTNYTRQKACAPEPELRHTDPTWQARVQKAVPYRSQYGKRYYLFREKWISQVRGLSVCPETADSWNWGSGVICPICAPIWFDVSDVAFDFIWTVRFCCQFSSDLSDFSCHFLSDLSDVVVNFYLTWSFVSVWSDMSDFCVNLIWSGHFFVPILIRSTVSVKCQFDLMCPILCQCDLICPMSAILKIVWCMSHRVCIC